MNRRERRAAVARGKPLAGAGAAAISPPDTSRLIAQATQSLRNGNAAQAEAICKQILARAPAHKASLNLLGLIHQASGHHRLAVKMFAKAIAADPQDAACHYNIAGSYQLLHEGAAAATHFTKALALGLSGWDTGALLLHNPAVAEVVERASAGGSTAIAADDPFGERAIAAIANDIFLRCALQTTLICGVRLETCLTRLRLALLRLAKAGGSGQARLADDETALFCALAQQCFINEYVYVQSEQESLDARRLRAALTEKLSSGHAPSLPLLAAVAAYAPLHAIAGAQSLLAMDWPDCAAELLRQQITEPLAEAEDRRTIAALTAVDDPTSVEVMQQYEENPYPRWTVTAPTNAANDAAARDPSRPGEDILIAACGTGRHAFYVAQQSPRARILAVDLSRASLAYARKKSRAAGLGNIEYGQADILKLAGLGRTFDRIEAIGVLHHLADPNAGWRALLSLLKPNGIMRIGLYSEAARQAIVEARAIIAERRYSPTAEGIRALRQEIIGDADRARWRPLLETSADFYCTSGCRDMFFNVMEHRFTVPQIAALLRQHRLSFLGFELDRETIDAFARLYPGAQALRNLDYWHAFETAHPQTFRRMYVFEVCREGT